MDSKKEFIQSKLEEANSLGSRFLSNGVQLLGHVPNVAPEAYLHIIYPPIEHNQLEIIEQEIGIEIPQEFGKFLSFSNGINVFMDSVYICGYRVVFDREGDLARQPYSIFTPNTIERPYKSPRSALFIGGYGNSADLLYIETKTNQVHRCRNSSAKSLEVWSDFWTMLVSEVERISRDFHIDDIR